MELFGVRVDAVTLEEVVKHVANRVGDSNAGGRPLFIVTPNPEQIVQAQGDGEFRRILNEADLAVPDGWGIVVASLLLAKKSEIRNSKHETNSKIQILNPKKIPSTKYKVQSTGILTERVAGVEVMEKLIERAAQEGWRVMLVGGKGEMAEKAAENLRICEFTNLRIKGIRGITDIKNPDGEEEKRVIEEINEFGPDLLFVGYGAPWQEKWVAKQLKTEDLKLKVKVVMVVGGALDQMADPTLKPPRWLDGIGLGWLYRLIRQPWRWKRQLRLVRFGGMVFRQLLSGK